MTNDFYSTHCKTITSLVLILDCMSFLITIVEVLNFLQNFICTLSAMDNCKIFKILAIAKFWQLLSRIDKLNALVTRKTEYFSFSKHPCHQIFMNNIESIDNDDHTTNAAQQQQQQ